MYLYVYIYMVFKIHADNVFVILHFENITLIEEWFSIFRPLKCAVVWFCTFGGGVEGGKVG